MTEQEQENRIGQWFVDAKDPTKWYGPVKWLIGEYVFGQQSCRGSFGMREESILNGRYLRIPPRLDLPTGLRTRECRLPKEGERFEWSGIICDASQDWQDAGCDDFDWRRWIVEDEPEAEPAEPRDENQNFAAKFREAQKEIDRLRRLEAAVVNREFVWQCPCTDCEDTTDCQDAICAALLAAMKGE